MIIAPIPQIVPKAPIKQAISNPDLKSNAEVDEQVNVDR